MTLQEVIDCPNKEFVGQSSPKQDGDYKMVWKIDGINYTIQTNIYTGKCELVKTTKTVEIVDYETDDADETQVRFSLRIHL